MDFYEINYGEKRPYLGPWSGFTVKNVINELFSYVVLYYYIIPISLYVTVELQRFLGTLYLKWDIDLSYRGQNASAKTSDINEDLGQVQYLFTDKTGTLTENEMRLRQFSANGICYIEDEGRIFRMEGKNEYSYITELPMDVENLFLAIVICHTVHCNDTTIESRSKCESYVPCYEASSTDEKALVEACARIGVIYLGEEAGLITINFRGQIRKFRKLRINEFTSDTKRMSVLITQEYGKGLLFCKGADCAVFPLVKYGNIDQDKQNLKTFSMKGLRTLTFAYNEFHEEELKDILNLRDIPENNLVLLGVTALEDRLQENVGKTLCSLKQAGIKIWILTGDHFETARMVGLACGHLVMGIQQLNFVGFSDTVSSCFAHLTMLKSQIQNTRAKYNLIMDGISLKVATEEPECLSLLMEISLKAHSVLCCRLAPKQKAQIIRMVKDSASAPVTLAIGDGANDVAMIQEAHIGIGILGKEGRQAVNNADFVLPAFFTLKRILFVHGHWYYLRLAILVQYFFYKNVVFITPQVFFAIHNGVSPQPLFSSVFLLLYNTTFTSLPVLIYSLLEQDYTAEKLMAEASLYTKQSNNTLLAGPQFFKWFLYGLWHSIVVYFVPWALINYNPVILIKGQIMDLTSFGTTVIHCSVIVVNLKLLLCSHFWTLYFVLSFLISIVGFIIFTIIFNLIDNIDPLYNVYTVLVSSPDFWLLTFIVTSISLIPDCVLDIISNKLLESHAAHPTFKIYSEEDNLKYEDTTYF